MHKLCYEPRPHVHRPAGQSVILWPRGRDDTRCCLSDIHGFLDAFAGPYAYLTPDIHIYTSIYPHAPPDSLRNSNRH